MNNLYDQDSLKVMAFAEEAYVRGSSRLEEIRNYARKAGSTTTIPSMESAHFLNQIHSKIRRNYNQLIVSNLII